MDWYYGRQEVAVVWSDASLDEEEEFQLRRFSSLGSIELEHESEIENALKVIPEHRSFDKFVRDALHYLLCTNNILKKPLRPVYMSVKSPFTKNIGLALNVEQILSRSSLKAVFMSRNVRKIEDLSKAAFFIFFYRSCKFSDQEDMLMTELVVIVFELFLYCLIEEKFIVQMKDVVRVITDIYTKLLKPTFEKRNRRWKTLMKYAYVMYSQHFLYTRMVFKTLGHPYDVFPIPDTMKDMYKRKVACMINTFYDFVPLWNFWAVMKEYKEEVANLDLTPDPHFKIRTIMRKAERRKKHRRAKIIQSRISKRFNAPEKDIAVKLVAGGSSGGSRAKIMIQGTESNDNTVLDIEEVVVAEEAVEEVVVAEEAVEEVDKQSKDRKENYSESDSNIDYPKTKSLLPHFLRAFRKARPEAIVDTSIFPDESTIDGTRPKAVIGSDLYSDPSTDYLVDLRSPRTRVIIHKAKTTHKSVLHLEEMKDGKEIKVQKVSARPKAGIGKGLLSEKSTSDPKVVGDARPKTVTFKDKLVEESTFDPKAIGGAKSKVVISKIKHPEESTSDVQPVGARPEVVFRKTQLTDESTSEFKLLKSREKVKKPRKFKKKRETLDTENISSEHGTKGSIHSSQDHGAVGGEDHGAVGEDHGAVGGEDHGAVGNKRYDDFDFSDSLLKAFQSHSEHKRTSEVVPKKPKQPTLKDKGTSRNRFSRRVYFDANLLACRPVKKMPKPIKKKIAVQDPREVVSDLECYFEKDSDIDTFIAKLLTSDSSTLQTEKVEMPCSSVPQEKSHDLRSTKVSPPENVILKLEKVDEPSSPSPSKESHDPISPTRSPPPQVPIWLTR